MTQRKPDFDVLPQPLAALVKALIDGPRSVSMLDSIAHTHYRYGPRGRGRPRTIARRHEALRVLWELRDGSLGFRELRGRCDGMSSSVLSDRLAELTAAGLVAKDADERHALTRLGRELSIAIEPLSAWSQRWARQVS